MLIDCGKSFAWTLERLNYELPDALLLTHEHGDHSKAAKKFLERGVEMFMTQGTADALKFDRHNLHVIRVGETFTVGGLTVEAIESVHDAAEPVNFILSDDIDRVLFVTDTGELPDVTGDFTQIFIEANYDLMKLFNAPIPNRQRARIIATHLSIRQAERFTKKYPSAKVEYLHRSKRHGRSS